MLNSLRQIRNSASKKKAEKIFRQAEERSPSPVERYEESGVYSMRDGDEMDDPAIHCKRYRKLVIGRTAITTY